MSRLHAIDPEEATGKAKELIDTVQKELGMIPNLYRVLANAPAVLEACLGMKMMLENGNLSRKLQEQIALTVSEISGCSACVSEHIATGRPVGLSEQEIADSRKGISPDPRTEEILRFARKVVMTQGRISGDDVEPLRRRRFTDGEIVEVIAQVLAVLFTNAFNNAAGTIVDFPGTSVVNGIENEARRQSSRHPPPGHSD